MSDRDLLEKAAKAAGIQVKWKDSDPFHLSHMVHANGIAWNPLDDDGDALRLAVKLRISLIHEQQYIGGPVLDIMEATCPAHKNGVRHVEAIILNELGSDEAADTRRAIVQAAAWMWDKRVEMGLA